MKKIFLFALGIFSMTAIHAANTEVARITITGQGGTESSYVTLRVDPSISANETASYLGATEEEGQVNIYAIAGTDKYSAFKSNAISELELQVVTNRRAAANQHYTLTFNVPTLNEGLTLYDSKTDTYTPITNGATYEFDVNTTLHPDYVEGQNYVVTGRFLINHAAPLPTVKQICFNDEKLQLSKYAGAKVDVYLQGEAAPAKSETVVGDALYEINLSALAAGEYVVKIDLDGDAAIDEQYRITVKPTLSAYTPVVP